MHHLSMMDKEKRMFANRKKVMKRHPKRSQLKGLQREIQKRLRQEYWKYVEDIRRYVPPAVRPMIPMLLRPSPLVDIPLIPLLTTRRSCTNILSMPNRIP